MDIWRYSLKSIGHEGWAVFMVDAGGMLAACSDYGNYAYHWPRNGWGPGGFREFLVGVDGSYLLGKLSMGRDKVIYEQETRAAIRRYIAEAKRGKVISPATARSEVQLLKESDLDSDVQLYRWIESSQLGQTMELREVIVRGPPRDLVQFVQRCWPRFVELLKADLAVEATK